MNDILAGVKTAIEIPDELLARLKDRASRDGRELDQVAVSLLAAGLGAVRSSGDGEPVPGTLPMVKANPAMVGPVDAAETRLPRFAIDPATGLRVIISPPNAPIHSMSVQDTLSLEQSILEEQDLERVGLPIRH